MATFTVDLLSGNLYLFNGDFTGSGSTPTSGSTYPEVSTYDELPDAGSYSGQIYVVKSSSGEYVADRKPSGFYISSGSVWHYLGETPEYFKSDNFQVYDANDTSKGVEFVTSGISTNVFRQLKIQNTDGTIAYLIDLNTKLDTSIFSGYTGITAPNTFLKLDQTTPQVVSGGSPQFDGIQFDLLNLVQAQEGELRWNGDAGVLEFGLSGGEVVNQIGLELLVKVTNKTGTNLKNGQIVHYNGAIGNRPTITLANANETNAGMKKLGMLTEDIDNNQNGYVTTFGIVRDIDTLAYSAGTILYLSTVSGAFTDVQPNAPAYTISLAVVLRQHQTEGIIQFSPTPAPKLTDLADVDGTPLTTNGQILVWNQDTTYLDFDYNINDYLLKTTFSGYTGTTNARTEVTGTTYVPQQTDKIIGILGTTGGTVTINLPQISTVNNIKWIFKDEGFNASTNTIIFNAFAGEFIEKESNVILSVNGGSITIYNDGTSNWYVI